MPHNPETVGRWAERELARMDQEKNRTKKICVAVSHEVHSFVALDWATHLALGVCSHSNHPVPGDFAKNSEIVLMHVHKDKDTDPEAARQLLRRYASRCESKKIPHRALLYRGDPSETLIDAVKAEECDCLAVGSRDLGAFRRTFMGSISHYAVDHAPCPVFVAKSMQKFVQPPPQPEQVV
eukprot:CAMPEP_0114558172 /NCGR_PEP_ID=MMETSP0114-20121206/10230_1 /TAXON_ID=31324 /ORGANISM="Goniomonas sp, Strain m" /LENGTH=180 /DNA_ID=CAMNT_0001743525 /DNA_START=5 /DNA_END=547 /DNA_ORIENTATION=+